MTSITPQTPSKHHLRSTPESVIVRAGLVLATHYHRGQTRKGDGQPYITHPITVAEILKQHGFSDETVAAGYCHDLLEDTECSEEEILNECGPKVLEIVESVTNDETLPWKEKKLKYIATVRIGSDDAKAVCVADKIHNLESLFKAYKKYGPPIWSNFNKGKKDKLWFEKGVLKMLQDTWDHPLIAKYKNLIQKMEKLDDFKDIENDFIERFQKMDATQLATALNRETSHAGWTLAKEKYLTALRLEIAKRGNSNPIDPLFADAVELVLQKKLASASLIKRNLGVGFNRAAIIFDQLEAAGIIGKFNGAKPRKVFISKAKKYLKDK